MASEFLEKYIQVNVGSTELRANPHIKQEFEFVEAFDKQRLLVRLLPLDPPPPPSFASWLTCLRPDVQMKILGKRMDGSRTLIFCETKRGCDAITRMLRQDGYPALAIHGDKGQQERDWVLAEFKSGRSPLMVATDVAARGLDVPEIKLVINFDMPRELEDYVHRIGRTGRKTKKGYNEGTSISFFCSDNYKMARPLVALLDEAKQPVPDQLRKYAAMPVTSTYSAVLRLVVARVSTALVSLQRVVPATPAAVVVEAALVPTWPPWVATAGGSSLDTVGQACRAKMRVVTSKHHIMPSVTPAINTAQYHNCIAVLSPRNAAGTGSDIRAWALRLVRQLPFTPESCY